MIKQSHFNRRYRLVRAKINKNQDHSLLVEGIRARLAGVLMRMAKISL